MTVKIFCENLGSTGVGLDEVFFLKIKIHIYGRSVHYNDQQWEKIKTTFSEKVKCQWNDM